MFDSLFQRNGVKWKEVIEDDEARVLDVRENYEWDGGHYEGAEHLPLGAISNYKDDGRKVYVYCASGGRSERAVIALKRSGVDAVNVQGGYHAYERLKKRNR